MYEFGQVQKRYKNREQSCFLVIIPVAVVPLVVLLSAVLCCPLPPLLSLLAAVPCPVTVPAPLFTVPLPLLLSPLSPAALPCRFLL